MNILFELGFFICYSYFHIPCLFSFIVSVSFFDFLFLFPSTFFFPPIFCPLLFFKKYRKTGTMGIAKQLPVLSAAARLIFN